MRLHTAQTIFPCGRLRDLLRRSVVPGQVAVSFGNVRLPWPDFRIRIVRNLQASLRFVHAHPRNLFRSSPRPISSSQLHTLLYFHLCPIYLVVFKGSYSYDGISLLEGGFTLRCLQRLSRPDLATRLCTWQYNRYTRGQSIPVLSY